MPKVWVPSPMRDVTGGQHTLDIPGRTVREVLTNLTERYPQARERLFRPDGTLQPHLALMVDGAEVRSWNTALAPDSELIITAALGGG
ncbi:MAG TPA: MoaD/ThiS family protein [Limnochordales bacterium]